MTMTDTDTPRAWVGCLACYNDGRLIGAWLEDPDEMREWTCPKFSHHEEFWVMDHENYGPFLTGECNPCTAADRAELIEAIRSDDNVFDFDAVLAWIEDRGEVPTEWDRRTQDDFSDAYVGQYDSFKDLAYEYVDEGLFGELPDSHPLSNYIDYDAIARDLEIEMSMVNGYIFRPT